MDGRFGGSVAIEEDRILVGAWNALDPARVNSGAAYLFERDADGPGTWGLVTKLAPSDGVARDRFGHSVAIRGEIGVVGAPSQDFVGDQCGYDCGAAYVFERDAGGPDAWGEVAKLFAPDGRSEDNFGEAVTVQGETTVIGAHKDDIIGLDDGSAYVFRRDAGGPGAWGGVAKLVAGDPLSRFFGRSVTMEGDTLAVGCPGYITVQGSTFIFREVTRSTCPGPGER